MKTKFYLRIAKDGVNKSKVVASSKPNPKALSKGQGRWEKPMPTVQIALTLDIPDKEFDKARIALEAKIKETTPAVEIKQAEQ